MKKALKSSLLSTEITAFFALMLLFFLSTNKPYLLLVPIAGVIGCYLLLRKFKNMATWLVIALPFLVGILITAATVALLYIA